MINRKKNKILLQAQRNDKTELAQKNQKDGFCKTAKKNKLSLYLNIDPRSGIFCGIIRCGKIQIKTFRNLCGVLYRMESENETKKCNNVCKPNNHIL